MAVWIDRALFAIHRTRLFLRIGLVLGGLVLLGGSVASLWPTTATRLNQLGYGSVCPFAPFSSAVLLIMAAGAFGGLYALRGLLRWRERRLATQEDSRA